VENQAAWRDGTVPPDWCRVGGLKPRPLRREVSAAFGKSHAAGAVKGDPGAESPGRWPPSRLQPRVRGGEAAGREELEQTAEMKPTGRREALEGRARAGEAEEGKGLRPGKPGHEGPPAEASPCMIRRWSSGEKEAQGTNYSHKAVDHCISDADLKVR